MSFFILVERFGAPRRLLRSRALALHVGEDEAGVLACRQPARPYFSIYAFGDRYLCKVDHSEFRLRCAKGDAAEGWITEGDVVSGLDYSFTFFITSTRAEVAAQLRHLPAEDLSAALEDTGGARLRVLMAGLWRSFPVFCEHELSLGSNPDNAVFVDLTDVAPKHCTFRGTPAGVEINPVGGSLTLDGRSVAGACSISSDGTIMLEPSGLKLEIEFQRPCTTR